MTDIFSTSLGTIAGMMMATDAEIKQMYKEMQNYYNKPVSDFEGGKLFIKPDKGYYVIVNTSGMDADKIEVNTVAKHCDADNMNYIQISVNGEDTNKYTEIKYSVNFKKTYRIKEKITEVSYICENGQCIIFIKTEQPKKPEPIKVTKVTKDFTW